jgi:XTP/dITP diphosphohydrolase
MPDEQARASVDSGSAGQALIELVAVMDRLRRECPWDAKQTHESLRTHLLEESYETLDALDRGQADEIRDELGDLLLQVLFHARIAAERTDGTGFDVDDVARGIAAKLIRRHPHVFADVVVADADEVRRNWDQIKVAERAERAERAGRPVGGGSGAGSVLDSVPLAQPALALAAQLQRRAEAAGVPDDVADLPTSGDAEVPGGIDVAAEPGAAGGAGVSGHGAEPGESGDGGGAVSELGVELFALVARARAAGLDPELELRKAALVYRDRVRAWESSKG